MNGLYLALLVAAAAEGHDPTKHEFQFVGIPAATINTDEGIGGGGVLALYHYYGGVEPVRDDVSLRLFVTSKFVQRHELRWDGRDAFGLPVRVWLRFALFSTVTQTYCGVGSDVTCDPVVASKKALDEGLSPSSKAYQDFVRRYYEMRYIRPSADTLWRLRVRDFPERTEVMAGWRLAWYRPGDFFHRGPYPGSLYAQSFPDGEPGVSSVWQLGFTIDDRDFEPEPSRGFFFEASARASHPWWGSHWKYAGMNASLSTYLPVRADPLTVLANRAVVDVLTGDVPTEEIAETGGTRDYPAFGGQYFGRGIRDHRYIGKVKVMEQFEARTHFFDVNVLGFQISTGGALFVDAGYIASDLEHIGVEPVRILYGGGAGLRLLFQDAINTHVDLAASPFETRQPSFYTPAGYPF